MKTFTVEYAYPPTSCGPMNELLVEAIHVPSMLCLTNPKYNDIGFVNDRRACIERVYEKQPDGSRVYHFENRHLALHHRISKELLGLIAARVEDKWAEEA